MCWSKTLEACLSETVRIEWESSKITRRHAQSDNTFISVSNRIRCVILNRIIQIGLSICYLVRIPAFECRIDTVDVHWLWYRKWSWQNMDADKSDRKRCMAKRNERNQRSHIILHKRAETDVESKTQRKQRNTESKWQQQQRCQKQRKNTIIIYSAIFVGHLIRKEQRWTKRFSLCVFFFHHWSVHRSALRTAQLHSVSFRLVSNENFQLYCANCPVRTSYSYCTCTMCNLCFVVPKKEENSYGQKIHKRENSAYTHTEFYWKPKTDLFRSPHIAITFGECKSGIEKECAHNSKCYDKTKRVWGRERERALEINTRTHINAKAKACDRDSGKIKQNEKNRVYKKVSMEWLERRIWKKSIWNATT